MQLIWTESIIKQPNLIRKVVEVSNGVGQEGNSDAESEDSLIMSYEEAEKMVFKVVGACYLCTKLGQTFKSEENVRDHFVRCRVHPYSMHVQGRACRLATWLIASNEFMVYTKPTENPVLN